MRLNRYIKAVALSMVMTMVLSFSALAATVPSIGDYANLTDEEVATVLNEKFATSADGMSQPEKVTLFNNVQYWYDAGNVDAYTPQNLKADLQNQNNSQEKVAAAEAKTVEAAKKDVDAVKGLNIKPDLQGGSDALSGFSRVISLLTGILATLAVIGTTIFTACDICYIGFPFLHAKMEKAGSSGGTMSAESKSGKGTKFALVTDDAISAYEDAQKNGGSPWGLYLKKRIVTFIMLAIIIYILLTGNITIIIKIALNLVGGIVDQLNKFAESTKVG